MHKGTSSHSRIVLCVVLGWRDRYIVNYTVGGRLVDSAPAVIVCACQFAVAKALADCPMHLLPRCTHQPKAAELDWNFGYKPPPARSPGSLRWGRGEGCDFVTKSPVHWSDR